MKKLNILASLAAGFGLLTACSTAQNHSPEPHFTSLFDGKTLNGWSALDGGNAGYFIKDGVLVCPKGTTKNLYTAKDYSDFVLRLDFKVSPGGNNGIGIRAPFDKALVAYEGSEIQILDDNAPEYANLDPGQYCGSVYKVFPAKRGHAKPAGEWNSYEITAVGRHIKIVLNGKKVVDGNFNDIRDPEILHRHPGMFSPRGRIALLSHNTEVEFRNIRVKEMPHYYERDNVAPDGFTAMFDGKTLNGWKGLVADPIKRAKMSPTELAAAQAKADELMRKDWRVENGHLVYHGKGFDNLCSVKDYGDFELLVDWKIEPKGDSGIYLRGSPQVQIWERNSGGVDLQHPGSGGLYNNKKHQSYASKFADHYVGEWNRFRIVMVGEKVHVFLNNELVVDNVTMENYWDRSQPIFPSGSIELQAHHDPIYFKNIYVRQIPRVETKKK